MTKNSTEQDGAVKEKCADTQRRIATATMYSAFTLRLENAPAHVQTIVFAKAGVGSEQLVRNAFSMFQWS